jgi:hypothetical protein
MPRPATLTGNAACQVFHEAGAAVFPHWAYCPWTSQEDATCVRVAAPPYSFAATATAVTATAPQVCQSGRRTAVRAAGAAIKPAARPSCPRRTAAPLSGETSQKVTHQGSPPQGPPVPLRSEPTVPAAGALALLSLPSPLAGLGTPGLPALSDSPSPTRPENAWPLPPKLKRKSCATTTPNAGRSAPSPPNSTCIATVWPACWPRPACRHPSGSAALRRSTRTCRSSSRP